VTALLTASGKGAPLTPTHANDTFVGSVWAITSDLHTEVDRAATPNRAPNFYG